MGRGYSTAPFCIECRVVLDKDWDLLRCESCLVADIAKMGVGQ